MREEGWRITFYCLAANARCTHSWRPTWDQIIQYFGPDADWTKDRAAFERLVCEACGGRGASVIVVPAADTLGMGGAGGAHDHQPSLSKEEIARNRAEFEADRKRRGIKSNAELAAESRAERKRIKEAEKESSKHFIGPPNPWKYRKKGRWI
jgi:hypothetical protein